MATYDTAMPASMTNHTSDPLCPKFKKLKEEEKLGGKGRPLLGSKDVGKRVVGGGKRVANFCAGPAAVSDQVLLNLQHELLSYESSGMGLIEHSHRDVGGPVQTCMSNVCDLLREVLDIPDNYHVLLMQGGAHGQFAALPLNLLGSKKKAAYVDGGFWSHKAANEAKKYCETVMIEPFTTNKDGKLVYPEPSQWKVDPEWAYIHICANETINGLEFIKDPPVGTTDVPIVADFTSTLMSRPVDVSKYGVIYASGGKNLGPSGSVVVIVNDALLGRELPICPGILSYSTAATTKPIANLWYTPNVFAVRALNFVLSEVAHHGGLNVAKEKTSRKAYKVYKAIDLSDGFYVNNVADEYRSQVTIPFTIGAGKKNRPDLEKLFCEEAERCNLHQLAGHHTCGGLRVCIYNSVPACAVDIFFDFMISFKKKYAHK
ncbi:phosphoserine aminotransferase [Chloropicon roscoffensis]|uniref:phosphoserine transaminase n=1 Tax=Chloropicon roscoffensis TaxID=1461544 RepID=A0AAX4PFE1_9CHLO|mmetsp:Transcript_1523/g.4751  ORF Transcript_1523/g.4751 Transcript_1523/m.4751 type:complete len:431 (-) Transcript_1523:1207-2499(-)